MSENLSNDVSNIDITIKVKNSPSSLHAAFPGQNISNHPKLFKKKKIIEFRNKRINVIRL